MAIALSGSLVITGSIFATQGITGSFSGSATSASYADTLQGLGSASFAPAATFNTVSQSFATTSGSLSTRVTNLESTSSTVSSSFASTSGSIAGRVTLIEGQYATTGSNTFTGPQYVSQASNAISFTSTASLYTDGGLRVSKDSFVSGTAYFNNVVVYGTSSIQYITSSQVNFGTNIITVNTDTPAVRFGGLAVFDSGSTQLTGSMLWDSEKNHWIYSNPSGSTYNSAMLMNGPRNTGSLGSEQGTTACAMMIGQGGDHITSSMIYSYGNATCFYGTSYVSASGDACFAGTVCAPSFVGGTLSGTTIYGSTAVCSAIGKFTTCLDLGGVLTGTSATFSMPSGNGALTIANSCLSGKNWTLLPNTNGAESDLLLYYAGASAGTRLTIASTGAATFISSLGYGAGFGLFPRGQGVTDWYLGRYISSPETIDNAIGSLGGNAWRIGYTSGSSFVPTISLFAGGSATFSSTIQNVSGIYVRASGNSDLPFINFSNADGVYNWGRVGGLLQGDGDGSLYFQTKLGGSLGTRLTITSTGASTFACTIQANGGNITSFSSTGAAAFGNGMNIHTQPGTYTTGHGGILQFQNEDVITGGIRAIRDGGSWGGALLFYTHNTSAGNTFDTTFVERMRITSDGNVLIGTGTTPEGPLDVYRSNSAGLGGHILLRNNGAAVGNETAVLFVDGGVGSTRAAISSTTENAPYLGDIKFKTGAGSYASLTTRMTITGAGVVQITNTSDAQLSLSSGGTSAYVKFANSAGDTWGIGNSFSGANTDFQLYNFTTAAYGFRVSRGGIYANTTATAANVQIDSNGYFARSTSSLKYKNSVTNYDKGLDIVNQLRPVYYKGNNDGDTIFAGLIAEEVHDLGLTEFVQYAEDGTPDALAYSHMVALLTKAIQELKAELDQAKAEIEILKNK